jgi:hypothetical protein
MTQERTDKIPEHRKIGFEREHRLQPLKTELIAAALEESTITLDMTVVRKKGLLAFLRHKTIQL